MQPASEINFAGQAIREANPEDMVLHMASLGHRNQVVHLLLR